MKCAFIASAAGIAFLGFFASCDENLGTPVKGLESLQVTMVYPPPDMRGTADNPTTITDVAVDVVALDADQSQYSGDPFAVDVYLSYGGSKIGQLEACGLNEDTTPLDQLHINASGALDKPSCATDNDCPKDRAYMCLQSTCYPKIHLEKAFGHSTLWLQQHVDPPATGSGQIGNLNLGSGARAFGASPELTYRNPYIDEVQSPLDINSPEAMYCIPFNGKQITVDSGRYDERSKKQGQLVVTSLFSGGYVVADTGAMYDPATDTGGFNHLYVFNFGAPPAFVMPGRVLNKVEGNVSKFVGFTELNFPIQEPTSAMDTAQLPPPYVLTGNDIVAPGKNIHFLKLAAATVQATAIVCPVDTTQDSWKKFNNFVITYKQPAFHFNACDSFNDLQVALPSKVYAGFDPLQNKGKEIQVTGMLQNLSGNNDALATMFGCTVDADCAKVKPDGSTCELNSAGAYACTFKEPPNCMVDADCVADFTSGAQCIEGTCKKGGYNFWEIIPRDPSDVVLTGN